MLWTPALSKFRVFVRNSEKNTLRSRYQIITGQCYVQNNFYGWTKEKKYVWPNWRKQWVQYFIFCTCKLKTQILPFPSSTSCISLYTLGLSKGWTTGVYTPTQARIFYLAKGLYWLRRLNSLLSIDSFSGGGATGAWSRHLTHLHLVQTLWMCGALPPPTDIDMYLWDRD